MPFIKNMRGMAVPAMTSGFCEADWEATTPCQREAVARLGRTLQLEQEAFLLQNPKIRYMLETYFSKLVTAGKSRESLKDAAADMIEICDDVDKYPGPVPQNLMEKPVFTYEDEDIERDLKNIYTKHYPPPPWEASSSIRPTPNTLSSSFISIVTSETTLPTPEPIPTPEATVSEVMLQLVSNTVDKAIYSLVNEAALRYDTAYVEISKAVEEAMEIPVVDIRADIAELFFCAYRMFELNIIEKERIAAEIAWEKRMRKKLKRTLRRLHNFKGYETPPTPKSEISSHPSYKVPPPRPCACHPQYHYNRYPKDRFGIYLPRGEEFPKESVTVPTAFAEDESKSNESGSSTPA
ncbi:uncharacterized protein LOC133516795 isoform X1 [Cydia pomonella]|uniref:uncharacterized protein LOC133516795 isoform X1 n=2 Tax=Cydia pomonella TaxID=82600 RepID=UPI002ADE1504|nr:uncharacterized protein LOC133516795 isoform X1 [Cydia pomonella]